MPYYYYCCLEAQLTMTNYYKYHYSVSASLKLPQDIKHTDSWANGRLITTTLYLADLINSATTSADIVVSWQGCCFVYCYLFLPIARLHFFIALLYLHVHSICTSVDVVDPFMEHQVKTNKQILNFPLPQQLLCSLQKYVW